MSNTLKRKLAGRIAAASLLALFATGAGAAQILGYAQNSSSNTVNGTVAAGVTTISFTDVAITVANFAGGGTPFAALIRLTATSQNAATVAAGVISQKYSGNFCISSGIGCSGTIYLQSITDFNDDFSGLVGGSSFTLSATTPPALAVTFSSTVLTPAQLAAERAVGFSFSNVTPTLSVVGGTVAPFTASQSGTFSANNPIAVPEPATLGLLGIALAGLGFSRRRKQA